MHRNRNVEKERQYENHASSSQEKVSVIADVYPALPDFLLASTFFAALYFPRFVSDGMRSSLIRTVWLEFPAIVSAWLISAVFGMGRREKRFWFVGITVFVSIFVLGFALINNDWSYVWVFAGLSVKRYLWLIHGRVKSEKAGIELVFANFFTLFIWMFSMGGVAMLMPNLSRGPLFENAKFMFTWGTVYFYCLASLTLIGRMWERKNPYQTKPSEVVWPVTKFLAMFGILAAGLGTLLYVTPNPEYIHVESPNGGRDAYIAQSSSKRFVVVDGKEGKVYDQTDELKFSPNGMRVAYRARSGFKELIVVDGIEGKPYDGVHDLIFSPDGERVAYIARSDSEDFFVVDGKEEKKYDQVDEFQFSPDGKRIAYMASSGGKWFVVVDDNEGKQYDDIEEGSLDFSPDGKRVAYIAESGGKQIVVVDEKEGKQYDDIGEGSLDFSPDGKRVAYIAESGGKQIVVVDEKEGKQYDGIEQRWVTFSPNWERVAYIARSGGKQCVVVDGKEGKRYDGIREGSVRFSADGKRVTYQASVDLLDDQWSVIEEAEK